MKCLKHCETLRNTRHLMRQYRRSMRRRRRSAWRSCRVTGNIGLEFSAILAIAELVLLRRCVTELLIIGIWVLFPNLLWAQNVPSGRQPNVQSHLPCPLENTTYEVGKNTDNLNYNLLGIIKSIC